MQNNAYNNDTSKDIVQRHQQNNVERLNDHPLSDNVFFSVTKRTEKIVTAIYLVTGLLNDTEPLQKQIRNRAVLLLDDMFGCLESSAQKKSLMLSQSIISVERLLSLFDVAHKIGSVSDMNLHILRKELLLLQSALYRELQTNISLDTYKEPHTSVDYHARLQELLKEEYESNKISKSALNDIKNKEKSFNKDVSYSVEEEKNVGKTYGHVPVKKNDAEKRRGKILDILKEKERVSMKDIATRITNCTEKTLQRDLATLIKNGLVEKEGEKRWSVYVYRG